jgi:hypothetical protein
MNRYLVCALMATPWASGQPFYLPDSAAGARPSTLAHVQAGIFRCELAAGAAVTMEDREVVVRFPVVSATAPRAKGIVLIDSLPNSQLADTPRGIVMSNNPTASKCNYSIHVILDKPVAEQPALVMVLGDTAFWTVGVSRCSEFREAGWMTLPVSTGQKPAQCLRDAGRVFDVEEAYVLDLRLSDEERAKPAKVQGQLPEKDIDEIRRTVFAMAQQEILKRLADRPHEAWAELLRQWPGRHALDISSADARNAAVYYAPNAGYQMELVDGKWTIVGG